MEYKFEVSNEGAGYRVQLKNEFGRLVSWAWNSNLYAAVLDSVAWQLKVAPGSVTDVIRTILNTDFREVETSLKMEIIKREFSGPGPEIEPGQDKEKVKKEVYIIAKK